MADIDLTNSDGDLVVNVCRDGTNISESEKTQYDDVVEYVDELPADPLDILVQTDALSTVTASNKLITEDDIGTEIGTYPFVSGAVEDNVVGFSTTGLLKDTGIAYGNVLVDADIGVAIQAYSAINVLQTDYATSTVGGTIKILVVGTDCYITTDGTTPGA